MKKILSTLIICIFLSGLCTMAEESSNAAKAIANESTKQILDKLLEEFVKPATKFFISLETCTPNKFSYGDVKLTIYGKTKNGRCHYADMVTYNGKNVPVQCYIPMPVAIGMSTTFQDMIDEDFVSQVQGLKEERKEQFIEISSIAHDYCDTSFLKKKK